MPTSNTGRRSGLLPAECKCNGNRIYSSKMLDELKAMPDSIFNFDLIHLDYFKDLYFNFRHSFEIINGLDISLGFFRHIREQPSRSPAS